MALDDFARVPLLFGPSPVHRLERLSEHLGRVDIWAKRVYLVTSGRIEPGSHVLYAHVGGKPALNAYAGSF